MVGSDEPQKQWPIVLYSYVSSDVGLVLLPLEVVVVLLVEGRYTEEFRRGKGPRKGARVHSHRPTENIESENDLRARGNQRSISAIDTGAWKTLLLTTNFHLS